MNRNSSHSGSAGRAAVVLTAFLSLVAWTGCETLEPNSPGINPGGYRTEPSSAIQVAAEGSGTNSTSSGTGLSSDLIQFGEKVQVTFSGVTDAPPDHEERIKEDGMINLPLLNKPILAAGKTRRQLEEEIHDLYVPAVYLRLTVTVKTEQRFFFVSGQVVEPGQHTFLGDMTLLKAIAAAGDFTAFAQRKSVEVTRANGKKLRPVNCVKAQKNPRKYDIAIYPGDHIHVPRRWW